MEMKPHLEKKTVSDEELFEKLNVCVSNEMERSQKFGSQLTPKVNAVQEAGDRQTEKNSKVEPTVIGSYCCGVPAWFCNCLQCFLYT